MRIRACEACGEEGRQRALAPQPLEVVLACGPKARRAPRLTGRPLHADLPLPLSCVLHLLVRRDTRRIAHRSEVGSLSTMACCSSTGSALNLNVCTVVCDG
jgi:hypothetical protein